MSAKTLEIQLLGKSYHIACPAGQEAHLHEVAERLNQRLETLRRRTGITNMEQLAVMAALNLSHESMQQAADQAVTQRQMGERIAILQDAIEQALSERVQDTPKTVEADPHAPYTGADS